MTPQEQEAYRENIQAALRAYFGPDSEMPYGSDAWTNMLAELQGANIQPDASVIESWEGWTDNQRAFAYLWFQLPYAIRYVELGRVPSDEEVTGFWQNQEVAAAIDTAKEEIRLSTVAQARDQLSQGDYFAPLAEGAFVGTALEEGPSLRESTPGEQSSATIRSSQGRETEVGPNQLGLAAMIEAGIPGQETRQAATEAAGRYRRMEFGRQLYDPLYRVARAFNPDLTYGYRPAQTPRRPDPQALMERRTAIEGQIASLRELQADLQREQIRDAREREQLRVRVAENIAEIEAERREALSEQNATEYGRYEADYNEQQDLIDEIDAETRFATGVPTASQATINTAVSDITNGLRARTDPSAIDTVARDAALGLSGDRAAQYHFFSMLAADTGTADWASSEEAFVNAIREYGTYLGGGDWEEQARLSYQYMSQRQRERRDAVSARRTARSRMDGLTLADVHPTDLAQHRAMEATHLDILGEGSNIPTGPLAEGERRYMRAPTSASDPHAARFVEGALPGSRLQGNTVTLPTGETTTYAQFQSMYPHVEVDARGEIVTQPTQLTGIESSIEGLEEALEALDDPRAFMSVMEQQKDLIVNSQYFNEWMQREQMTDVEYGFRVFVRTEARRRFGNDSIDSSQEMRQTRIALGLADAPPWERVASYIMTAAGPAGAARRGDRRAEREARRTQGDGQPVAVEESAAVEATTEDSPPDSPRARTMPVVAPTDTTPLEGTAARYTPVSPGPSASPVPEQRTDFWHTGGGYFAQELEDGSIQIWEDVDFEYVRNENNAIVATTFSIPEEIGGEAGSTGTRVGDPIPEGSTGDSTYISAIREKGETRNYPPAPSAPSAPEPLPSELPAFGTEEGQITPPTDQQRQRLEGILGFYEEQSEQEMPTGRFRRITREQASAEALRQQSAPYLNPLLGDEVDQDMRDRVASDPAFEESLTAAESREGIRAGRRSLRQRKRDARRR